MKKTELAVVSFALLLFFMVGPLTAGKDKPREEKQEQVAEEIIDDLHGENYRITFRAAGMKENGVADIMWLKKAAQVAMDAGIPHFNVRQKTISREYNRRVQRRLNVVEGVIELDNDPMNAEYDAQEILSLVLPEYTP
ncbi:MAG: hypothetical protein V4598_01165 [Bdellovibrionota bacterium]